jgi:hypothetical protein
MLVSYYRSGGAMRSRSVGDVVLAGRLGIPAAPTRLVADWDREIALHLALEPGDVMPMPLARARARWPQYRQCVQALSDWTGNCGLPPDLLATSDVALMACRGARYHHDGARYGGAAFCNLFVSEDKGLDLHFPRTGVRIPLQRGTAVLFDTGQAHAVIGRASTRFDANDFPTGTDCSQLFLTWELPIDNACVARALQIRHDVDAQGAALLDKEQVRLDGHCASVDSESGQWQPARA